MKAALLYPSSCLMVPFRRGHNLWKGTMIVSMWFRLRQENKGIESISLTSASKEDWLPLTCSCVLGCL